MKTKSFTLIELLVVIVIIGILAGVIVVSTSSAINKANFAKAQAFSSTVQNELLSDLVSEWTFDNVSNPTEDTWGNNDGTAIGATHQPKSLGNCVYGSCYSFNGGGYINCGNNNSLNLTNSMTISVWIYQNSFVDSNNQASRIVCRGHPNRGYDVFTSNNGTMGVWLGSSEYQVSNLLSLNTWEYITIIFNSSTHNLYFYVNGSVAATISVSETTLPSTNNNFYIANYDGGSTRFFKGFIDDVRVYKSALSSAQIKKEYVAGLNSLLANNNITEEEYLEKIGTLASN